jgi:hypothetical protein
MKDTARRSFLISSVGLTTTAVAGVTERAGPAAGSQGQFRQTGAEAEAGVTPTNLDYPAGDVRRYGADPSGRINSSAAWASAIACNDHVFDGNPGGGTYLFGSEVVISRYPVSISGAVKNIGKGSGGTRITLSSAAGPGKAIFHVKSFATGIRIEKLQFDWESYSAHQIGFHASDDLRASSVLDCSFVNSAGAENPTVIGIQLDGGEIYTGAVAIRDCYMAGLRYGVNLLGHCTTVRIRDNEFYGNVKGSSNGVRIANTCAGVTLIGNTFEGWSVGVYSEGACVVQVGNYFEDNAAAQFQWVRGAGNARIWNMSFADIFLSGGRPIYPFNGTDACMVLSGPGYASLDNVALSTSRGFHQVGRPRNEGYFSAPDFDPKNFTGSGSMQWLVTPQNVITYQASRVGETMTVNFYVADSKTLGTASVALKIAIPGGHVPAARVRMPCTVSNDGFTGVGMCEVVPGDGHVSVFMDQTASTNWTPSARTGAGGSITFQILT